MKFLLLLIQILCLTACRIESNGSENPHLPIKQSESLNSIKLTLVFKTPSSQSLFPLLKNNTLIVRAPKENSSSLSDYQLMLELSKSSFHLVEKIEVVENKSQAKAYLACSMENCFLNLHEVLEEVSCSNNRILIAPDPELQLTLNIYSKNDGLVSWPLKFENACDDIFTAQSNEVPRNIASAPNEPNPYLILIALVIVIVGTLMGCSLINKYSNKKPN